MGDVLQQLPQLEAMCERLYNAQVQSAQGLHGRAHQARHSARVSQCRRDRSGALQSARTSAADTAQRSTPCVLLPCSQDPQERAQVEGMLAVFGSSTEYVGTLKVRAPPTATKPAHARKVADTRAPCLLRALPAISARAQPVVLRHSPQTGALGCAA